MSIVRPSLILLALFTLLTGVIYPLCVTGFAQAFFSTQANGSIVKVDGKARGSALIGQSFTSSGYFWSRPSATAPVPYHGLASSGSNKGPLNPALAEAVKGRIEVLRAADPDNHADVPVDLVTASGSGLDPHISPAAARYQAGRVARARGLDVQTLGALIDAHTEARTLGLFGEPRVNVLLLNLALDRLASGHSNGR